jgi:receptor expression-enhancing protein 5/6
LIHPSGRLQKLEEEHGIPKVFIFLVTSVAILCTLFFIGGAKLISDLSAFLYPAYESFKAIDCSDGSGADTQWLTYWVVFAIISIFEQCAQFLVKWIPFYYFIKIGFFIWLYHPSTLGAGMIYRALRPFITPYMEMAKPQKKVA